MSNSSLSISAIKNITRKYLKYTGNITLPSAFDWFTHSVGLSLRSGYTSFDIYQFKPTGKQYFVRHTGGSDANDGLTYGTAYSSITKALQQVDVDEIILQPGDYNRYKAAIGNHTLTRDIAITVLGNGKARLLGSAPDLVWTLTGGYSATYEAGIDINTLGEAVADESIIDDLGDFLAHKHVNTIAECEATPASWYSDGVKLYVHCFDDRQPDTMIHAWRETSFFFEGGAYSVWAKNIEFLGIQNVGCRGVIENVPPTFYGLNCKFKYSQSSGPPLGGGGGFRSEGAYTFLVNCEAARNRYDGFNYHKYTGVTPAINACQGLELNCIGRHNGTTALGNNNGSTMHDAGSILRIGGEYFENEGPNVVDVHTGTVSYNISPKAFDSRKAATSRNYEIGTGTMYLVGAESSGASEFDLISSSGGVAYVYASNIDVYNGAANDLITFDPYFD